MANQELSLVRVWHEGNTIPITIQVTPNSFPTSLFVTITNNIYIGDVTGVHAWIFNPINSTFPLYTTSRCVDLFIDSNNSLYCSLYYSNQVIKRSLDSNDTFIAVVAGTSCSGYLNNSLYNPRGIFVDNNFNLYVADSGNNRIQLFSSGQSSPTTVAGSGAPQTIVLNSPTDVVLDADGYLFIVDYSSHRIVGSGPSGFHCIVGCSGVGGSGSNQLNLPFAMAFDSYGNIFVADTYNNRVQLFLLASNSCSNYLTFPSMLF